MKFVPKVIRKSCEYNFVNFEEKESCGKQILPKIENFPKMESCVIFLPKIENHRDCRCLVEPLGVDGSDWLRKGVRLIEAFHQGCEWSLGFGYLFGAINVMLRYYKNVAKILNIFLALNLIWNNCKLCRVY